MAALELHYMSILKKVLEERFVPYLPPLLDTRKPASEQKTKQVSRAFNAFVLHKLLQLTPKEAAAAVVDDFHDKGLDALYYDPNSETLYLLQAKLKESEQFKQDEALAFCEGVRLLLRQDFSDFNANVKNRQGEIESALDACSHIKLVVPYTGDGISKTACDALQTLLDDESIDEERLASSIEYYGADDIVRDLLAEQAYKPVNGLIGLQKVQKVEEPRTTYYGIVRISDLVSLHEKEGKALYERNIRYFLGSAKSEVNRAIKTTLRDNSEDFFYLNNGVTAVCDEIAAKGKNPTCGTRKFRVRGLSIINGAQTVASAAEFVREYPDKNIDDAKVMLTLIKAPTESPFSKRVTKARNHQNQVQTANFASLDENQERLHQELGYLGYEYHYRPEAAVAAGTKVVTLDEALRALALLQPDPRYPIWLKREPARLLDPDSAEYQALFSSAISGATMLNAALYYRAVRAALLDNEYRARGQERLVYRHGSLIIASALIKRFRNRITLPTTVDPVTLPPLISGPLDQIRQEALDLAHDHMKFEGPLAFFKKAERAVPFLIELMKKNYQREQFKVETDSSKLHQLAQEKVSLEQDLARRLAHAAPQL